MSDRPSIPDPEKVKQTVASSRRRRLEMEVVGLELEEVIAIVRAAQSPAKVEAGEAIASVRCHVCSFFRLAIHLPPH